jgi:hypothetical protein
MLVHISVAASGSIINRVSWWSYPFNCARNASLKHVRDKHSILMNISKSIDLMNKMLYNKLKSNLGHHFTSGERMTAENFYAMLGKMSPETRSDLELMVRAGSGEAKPVTGITSQVEIDEKGEEQHSLILKLAAGRQGPRGPRPPRDDTGSARDANKNAPKAAPATAPKTAAPRPAGAVTA